jgi:Polyketide cyclase / dehydrase and lipid transport
MWESTLEVTRKAVVQAAPEQAWALVSDSAAWSLRPDQFAFDVTGVTEAGRLLCWCAPAGTGPAGTGLVGQVHQVREDVPGQVLSLRSLGTQPAGRQVLTLAVRPHDGGALIELMVTLSVLREQKADYQAAWRKDIKGWLGALAEVAEGRRPWPEPGVPAAVREDWASRPLLTSPQGTVTAVVISAPAEQVWQAVRRPGFPGVPGQPYAVAAAGRVPGTPQGQPGELTYVIVRGADGRLAATLSMVRELAEGRSVLTQRLEPPHFETRYRVEPAPDGTRLELTMCWPDGPVTDEGEQLRGHLVSAVQATAGAYQAALGPGSG